MTKKIVWMFLLLVSMVFAISSCKKKGCTDSGAENYCEKCKTDDGSCTYNYAGTWSVTGNCGTYSMTTTVSGSTLTFTRLKNCYIITGSISGKTLTIPTQTVNASTSSCGWPYTLSGSGTFSGNNLNTLQLTYTIKDNSGIVLSNCSSTCTK